MTETPSDSISAPDEQDPPPRSSILRNVVHLMSSQVVTWTLSTVVFIVMPRFIEPAGLGQLRLAVALWMIAQVVTEVGTSMRLNIEFSTDPTHARTLVGPVIVIRVALFVVAALVMTGVVIAYDTRSTFVLVMALTGLQSLFASVAGVFEDALAGQERMAAPALAAVATKLIWSVGVIAVVVSGGDIVGIQAISAVSSVVGGTILYRAYRRYGSVSFAATRLEARWLILSSLGFFVAQAGITVYQQIDLVVISLLVDDETLGWYGSADVLFGTLLFIPAILSTALFPVLSRLHASDQTAFDELVQQVFAVILVAAVPVGLGMIVIGRPFAPLLFGEAFRPAGQVITALGPATTLVFMSTFLGAIALATGRQRLWNILTIAGIAMTIGLDVVLVPWADGRFDNGAVGGALAYVVTESVFVAAGLIAVAPLLLSRDTASRLVRVAVSGGLMFAASWPLRDEFLAIPIVVGVAVYAVAALITKAVTNNDRVVVLETLRRSG